VTTTLSTKGQIVLPSAIRRQDRIAPGQGFSVERIENGRYLLLRLDDTGSSGAVDWLLSCPVKGWFQPVSSESTDTL
jgi:AbrB family looped-hinge helix DNA binding protein